MRKSLLLGLAMLVASSALAQDTDPDGDAIELALQAALVAESAVQVDPTEARLLARTARLLRAGDVDRAVRRWKQFIESRVLSGASVDINTLVQWTLREAYLDSTEELRFFAEKVRYFNEQKKKVRELLNDARDCRWKGCATEDAVVAQIEKWEEELSSIGEDAQLANVDLQQVLQRQQQTVQLMSNISKVLCDTAKAVIRNLK